MPGRTLFAIDMVSPSCRRTVSISGFTSAESDYMENVMVTAMRGEEPYWLGNYRAGESAASTGKYFVNLRYGNRRRQLTLSGVSESEATLVGDILKRRYKRCKVVIAKDEEIEAQQRAAFNPRQTR